MQESALDEEYSLYEEYINKQKDSLQQQYDLVQEQIDIIEDFLSRSGLIAQEALARIQENSSSLYDDLISWNEEYGTGIKEDVTRAWSDRDWETRPA